MNKVKIGQPVPDMELHATDDQTYKLSDLQGKTVILYFYPKDSTPGCTTETGFSRQLRGVQKTECGNHRRLARYTEVARELQEQALPALRPGVG
jgi:AhpC/TSA family